MFKQVDRGPCWVLDQWEVAVSLPVCLTRSPCHWVISWRSRMASFMTRRFSDREPSAFGLHKARPVTHPLSHHQNHQLSTCPWDSTRGCSTPLASNVTFAYSCPPTCHVSNTDTRHVATFCGNRRFLQVTGGALSHAHSRVSR